MIKQYSLRALQKAMNTALALDPHTLPQIQALSGKVIEMVIKPLDVRFFMRFDQAGIELLADYSESPDTTIHSSPLGLIRLSLLPSSRVRSLFNDQITMSGDVELGHAVKKLFDSIDIDWEGHLAHFTGDVVAHQVGRFVRKGTQFKSSLKASLNHNISDYLQEEIKLAAPSEAVQDFLNDVDTLKLDVERLEAWFNLHRSTADETP